MVTLLSLLCMVCALAFVAALVMLVIRTVKKKPRKPFVLMAAASCVLFMVLCVAVSSVYEPREKPAPAPSVSEPVPASPQPSEESEKPEQQEPESTEQSAPVESQTPSVEPSAPTKSEPPAETDTENPEQPSAPDDPPSAENPLYAAEVKTGDVMSGIGGNKIGEYAWVEMPKAAMLALSQEEMVSYAKDVISAGKGSYNWFTIALDDGTGLVFHNCFYPVFSYGVLDADGSLSETLGSGLLLDESVGYEYSPAEGNP